MLTRGFVIKSKLMGQIKFSGCVTSVVESIIVVSRFLVRLSVCWYQFCFCALWAWERMSRSNNISAESGRLFLLRPSFPLFWADSYLGDTFDGHICVGSVIDVGMGLSVKRSLRSWTLSIYISLSIAIAWDTVQFYYLSSHMTLSTLLLDDIFELCSWNMPLTAVDFHDQTTVLYSMIQCDTVWYSMIQYSTFCIIERDSFQFYYLKHYWHFRHMVV